MSRTTPLPKPWSPEDEAGIRRWMHPESTHEPPVLFQVLQRHPALARRTQALGQELYMGGRLEPRDRQLGIMRICGLTHCAYEWGGQAAFWGPRVGVSDAECDALTEADPLRTRDWSARDAAIIAAVDDSEATGGLGGPSWAALREHLDDEQCLELLMAVGWYRTICTLCNALDLELEPWMRPWPGT